jgi:hypothetical protein
MRPEWVAVDVAYVLLPVGVLALSGTPWWLRLNGWLWAAAYAATLVWEVST